MHLLGGPIFIESDSCGPAASHETDLEAYDPQEVVWLHKEAGYRAAYIPRIPMDRPELIKGISGAFGKEGICMAETGYWENLQDRNEEVRKKNLREICDVLAAADETGVACVVSTIGTHTFGSMADNFNVQNFSDEVFDTAVENCRYILDQVKPRRTKFSYETFAFTALDSIDAIDRMIKRIDDPRFAVHLDSANLVNSVRGYFSYNSIVDECFSRFGEKIVSTHIKDLNLVQPSLHVEIREVIPGTGGLDLGYYLKKVNGMGHDIPCLMEHMSSPKEYDCGRKYLQETAADEQD